MQFLGFRRAGSAAPSEVSDLAPLPVEIAGGATLPPVAGRTLTREDTPPGIGTGAAYADLDAIGTVMTFPGVFRANVSSGLLQSARYYDLDDEGLAVDLWLFSRRPAAPTDNSALALSDADLRNVVAVVSFASFADAANGRFSQSGGLGLMVHGSGGTDLYGIAQARGALNIAASNLPVFAIDVVPD